MPSPRSTSEGHPTEDDTVTDLIGWAAFSCALVPVVLLWCGTSLAGAAGTTLGLAAVTAACRFLLRRSERGTARLLTEDAAEGAPAAEQPSPAPHRGRHQRTGTGSHRGGRHTGGNTPVG